MMKKKVCIRKDGVVFPFTPLLEAKGFKVEIIDVTDASAPAAPVGPAAPEAPVAPAAPVVDDIAGMTKAGLIEYASRVYNVALLPNMSKPDMLAELESLKAEAAKPPA